MSALVVAREMNPIVAGMVRQPALGFALKFALIALVVATAEICDRRRPGLARLVLIVGRSRVWSAPSATRIDAVPECVSARPGTLFRGPVAQR